MILLDWISQAYSTLGTVSGQIIDYIWNDWEDHSKQPMVYVATALGILAAELIYFNYSDTGRLLYVLIIAIIGAGVGAAIGLFVSFLLRGLATIIVLIMTILIGLAPIVILIIILFKVEWQN
jgi:hypothetical protein